MNYDEAFISAVEIQQEIACYCSMCEIAGSIRRKKADIIKDIEIVAMPIQRYAGQLKDIVNKKWGPPLAGAFPSKYTKIRARLCIDFFWCLDPRAWGMLLWIRTGPAEYVVDGLRHWKMISNGGYSKDCLLYDGSGKLVPTPEEQDVFDAFQITWTEPEKRK